MLLQVKIAKGSPVDVLAGEQLKLAEQLLSLVVDSLDVFGVHFWHVLVHLRLGALATHAHKLERSRDERGDLSEVLGFEVFEGGAELNSLVTVDQRCLDFRQGLIKRLKAHLILMLERLVQLKVEMREPQFAVLRRALPGDRLDNFADLLQVGLPEGPVVQQVDVHKLVDHVDDATVYIAELAVFSHQLSSLLLHLFVVLLDLNGVVPGDVATVRLAIALRVLDKSLKFGGLVNHHWLLAVDHLSTHGVEEVSSLLQRQALLVELLGIFSKLVHVLGNFEA